MRRETWLGCTGRAHPGKSGKDRLVRLVLITRAQEHHALTHPPNPAHPRHKGLSKPIPKGKNEDPASPVPSRCATFLASASSSWALPRRLAARGPHNSNSYSSSMRGALWLQRHQPQRPQPSPPPPASSLLRLLRSWHHHHRRHGADQGDAGPPCTHARYDSRSIFLSPTPPHPPHPTHFHSTQHKRD